MAFGSSGVFQQWIVAMNTTRGTGFTSMTADAFKAALMNNAGTPDKLAAVASTGYNTGQWTAASNEVIDSVGPGTNWAAGGRSLVTTTFAVGTGTPFATNTLTFDALDTAGAGNVTLTGVMGCLVYDSSITAGTVAKQGVCFNYFGGAQAVTAGTFTIVWNAAGIMNITV